MIAVAQFISQAGHAALGALAMATLIGAAFGALDLVASYLERGE